MAKGKQETWSGSIYHIKTGALSRRTTQEQLDESRTRAAGAPAPVRARNTEFESWAKGEIENRARHAVIGNYERKGRAPVHVLTGDQFSSFQQTGEWEGMPTPEEYGPQSYVPDDKEYT